MSLASSTLRKTEGKLNINHYRKKLQNRKQLTAYSINNQQFCETVIVQVSLTDDKEVTAVSKNSVDALFGGGLGQLPKPEYRPPCDGGR